MQWENVYVFISSTFNDMHAERDYLVKRVFPQLSVWCEERKLRLIDIDLRWGVSEADATENKRVVQVCLDRIDACRPFFLCFMGQRRGWVPDESDIGSETYESFPKLLEKHYSGSASVTEMEILHALIDPLHNGILRLADGSTQTAGPVDHALFFLRQPDYLKDITHSDTHKIYTNEVEPDPVKADAELKRWREEIIPRAGRPVFDYTASWQENESTPEIALPIYVPTTAPQGSETWKAAFNRWAKLWESKGVKVDGGGEITDGAELAKANAYNQAFTAGRLSGFRQDGAELADTIIEQLKAAIAERFGERTEQAPTSLQRELDQQAQFLQVASEGFIERDGDFDALNAYLAGAETKPFGLTAYAGMGKTSLLAHFIDTHKPKADESLHYRFVGGSDDSASAKSLVHSLLYELKETGKIDSDIPADSTDMMNMLPDLLAESGKSGKTIIVIDALNQLESGMNDLYWLPAALPENVKLIVSFKLGEESTDAYYRRQEETNGMILHGVKPFDNEADRRAVVAAYLERFFKELDESRIQALIESDGAENPLFLKIALSELRVFGVHNDLSSMIKSNFGNTPVSAYTAVLARMESDPVYTKLPPSISLPHVFGWLAHSRYGLSVEELCDLLVREKLADSQKDAKDAVYLIVRQLRPYLARRDGRIDFFYESFKIAATERYTKDHLHARTRQEWHKSLAEYFETLPLENHHKLMEQAWQLYKANQNYELSCLLQNFDWINHKQNALGVSKTVNDYELLMKLDGLQNAPGFNLIQEALTLSESFLHEHPEQLVEQLCGRLTGNTVEPIPQLLKQAALSREDKLWLRPLFPCFPVPGRELIRVVLSQKPVHAIISPIIDEAYVTELQGIGVWDLELSNKKGMLYTLPNSRSTIFNICISENGNYVGIWLEGMSDSSQIIVLHIPTKQIECEIPYAQIDKYFGGFVPDNENAVPLSVNPPQFCLSANGSYLIVGSYKKNAVVWDIKSNKMHKVLDQFKKSPNTVAALYHNIVAIGEKDWLCQNGRMFFSDQIPTQTDTPQNTNIYLFDAQTFELKTILKAHYNQVTSIAFSKDGQLLASGGICGIINVWDTKNWNMVSQIKTNPTEDISDGIYSLAFIDDGKSIIASSQKNDIKIWNIATGEHISSLIGHRQSSPNIIVSKDGSRALSYSNQELLVWDLHHAKTCKKQRDLDKGRIGSVGFLSNDVFASSTYQNEWTSDLAPIDRDMPQNGNITTWDNNGNKLRSYKLNEAKLADCIRFSKTGDYLFSTYTYHKPIERGFKVWGYNVKTDAYELALQKRFEAGDEWQKSVFSQDDKYVVDTFRIGRQNYIYILDFTTGKEYQKKLRGTAFSIEDLHISGVGIMEKKKYVILVFQGKGIEIRKQSNFQLVRQMRLQNVPDHMNIIIGKTEKRAYMTWFNKILVLNLDTFKLHYAIEDPRFFYVKQIELDSEEELMYLCGDLSMLILNVKTGELLYEFYVGSEISRFSFHQKSDRILFGDEAGNRFLLKIENRPASNGMTVVPAVSEELSNLLTWNGWVFEKNNQKEGCHE